MMSKPILRCSLAGAGLCLALFGGQAAACGPADPASEPVDLEEVRIAGRSINHFGRHLLGLGGERVRVAGNTPDFSIRQARAVLQPNWQEQVDWSVYGSADPAAAHVRLHFERRTNGSRRLCRVTEMLPAIAPDDERPGPPRAESVAIFTYGKDGRLEQVAHHAVDDAAPPAWSAASYDCYLYDVAGWPVAKVARHQGSCAQASADAAQLRYVHAPDGRLLRTFSTRGEYVGNALQRVEIVDTYGEDGTPRRRYARFPDQAPRLTALPQQLERGELEWHPGEIGVDEQPWRIQVDRPGVPAAQRSTWRFTLIKPEYLTLDRYYYPEGELEVVAEGRADSKGMIVLGKAQQRRLIELVQRHPGQLLLRVDGRRVFRLWPEVPQATWDTCRNPARLAAADCE